MDNKMTWHDHQSWESSWHGNCLATYWEETKQLEYSAKMDIPAIVKDGKYPFYDFGDVKSILDIGGGPVSMLLKTLKPVEMTVIDPCTYPKWIEERYKEAGITYIKQKGEDIDTTKRYDLVLLYNVLQHTDNPKKIIDNIRTVSKIIKVFEWINTSIVDGHPHSFKREQFDEWFGGTGQVYIMNDKGCFGPAWAGTFKGNHYE